MNILDNDISSLIDNLTDDESLSGSFEAAGESLSYNDEGPSLDAKPKVQKVIVANRPKPVRLKVSVVKKAKTPAPVTQTATASVPYAPKLKPENPAITALVNDLHSKHGAIVSRKVIMEAATAAGIELRQLWVHLFFDYTRAGHGKYDITKYWYFSVRQFMQES